MSALYRLLVLVCLVFQITYASAQKQEQRVSLSLDNVSVPELVTSIESQTTYHFYFKASQFDSTKISIHVANISVPQVLDSVFYNTAIAYSINSNKVYLTKGRELVFDLPIGFYGNENAGQENTTEAAMFDYLYTTEQKERLSEEAKLFEVGPRSNRIKTPRAAMSGFIRNAVTGEPVVGAVIYNMATKTGASTDPLGYYSLTIPTGLNSIRISCVGMTTTNRKVMLYGNGKLDIELKEFVTPLREVIVEAERGANISGTEMGLEKLDIKTMKQVPVAFGETDVVKVMLTLPGVQTVGESSTGLNVRGGATDQNLILFDNATLFNSSHLFGFFSTFNPDVVKGVELYKSGVPASYGGRLSSVMEVTTREGNKKKFGGSGGIGLVTGRLTLEGPIKKGKSSFLIGGRSTYSDWLLKKIDNKDLQKSNGTFYDFNLHLNQEINEKNTIDITGYYSDDRFKLNNDTTYSYNNINGTISWKHTFEKKLFSEFSTSYSQYKYKVSNEFNPTYAGELSYKISQLNAKADFSYFINDKNTFTFGGSAIRYDLAPGIRIPFGETSITTPDRIQDEQGLESAIYAGDKIELSKKLSLSVGLRYSMFNFLGPNNVINYQPDVPKTEDSIVDTTAYAGGKTIQTYHGPEYRLSARYLLSSSSSVKFSVQRMRQYIHMLSNTTAISPTDIWKLSDPHIRPQVGDQISVGYYKNLKSNTVEFSLEAYYKTMENVLDYKGGAVLVMNHHIETDLLRAQGRAYGIEMLLKKVTGKLNGWVSYTYSRSLLKTTSSQPTEMVNNGKAYPSNFDKPHSANLIANYRFSRRFSVSFNSTYSTGRPITIPLQKYALDGSYRLFYTDRNQFRIPDYFRVDFAMNFEGNHKIRKLAHSSWSFSVYNLTGRKNAYSVFFKSDGGIIKGYQLSIFGSPIPTLTYNFKF